MRLYFKLNLILCFLSFLLISCLERFKNNTLILNNRSNNSVYFIISENDNMFDYEKYLLFERIKEGEHISEIDLTGLNMSDEIEPNSLEELERYNGWKLNIERAKDKKIRFYIVEKDSVDKYGWKYINDNMVYNKKYLLTLKDLKNMNWEIIYE